MNNVESISKVLHLVSKLVEANKPFDLPARLINRLTTVRNLLEEAQESEQGDKAYTLLSLGQALETLHRLDKYLAGDTPDCLPHLVHLLSSESDIIKGQLAELVSQISDSRTIIK